MGAQAQSWIPGPTRLGRGAPRRADIHGLRIWPSSGVFTGAATAGLNDTGPARESKPTANRSAKRSNRVPEVVLMFSLLQIEDALS